MEILNNGKGPIDFHEMPGSEVFISDAVKISMIPPKKSKCGCTGKCALL
jgi:hypothetical protein